MAAETEAQTQDIWELIHKYQQLVANHSGPSEQIVRVYLTLGKLYERAGEKLSAIQEFAKAAIFYADHDELIKAMAVAQLIKRIDPKNEELLDRLEELYFMRQTVPNGHLEDYQEAMRNLEDLRQTPPEVSNSSDTPETEVSHDDEQSVQALRQVSLFARLSLSELHGVYKNSLFHHLAPGEPIISGGNQRRALFVILRGEVKVFGKDKEQKKTFLASLPAGAYFGEFALFGRIDRTLSVIASEVSDVLEIPREIILKLAKNRPQVTETLKELYRRRVLDTALARVPLFSQLLPDDRRKIIAYFKPARAKQGARIIKEAQPGDSMYFILAGKVDVTASLDDYLDNGGQAAEQEQLLLATLKSGDFFGEQALMTNEPRSATVTAQTDVALLKFSKQDLQTVFHDYPLLESALQIETYQKMMQKRISILNQIIEPD